MASDGDFLIFEGNRYSRKGFLFKSFAMSAVVSAAMPGFEPKPTRFPPNRLFPNTQGCREPSDSSVGTVPPIRVRFGVGHGAFWPPALLLADNGGREAHAVGAGEVRGPARRHRPGGGDGEHG